MLYLPDDLLELRNRIQWRKVLEIQLILIILLSALLHLTCKCWFRFFFLVIVLKNTLKRLIDNFWTPLMLDSAD